MARNWIKLTPCELHLSQKNALSTYSYLYAGLWNIESSDEVTHRKFCRYAKQYGVFNFGKAGVFAGVEGKPYYTYDNGCVDTQFIIQMQMLIIKLKSEGYDIQLILNKKLCSDYGITFKDRVLSKSKVDRLINTYFYALYKALDARGLGKCIQCKCNIQDYYEFGWFSQRGANRLWILKDGI